MLVVSRVTALLRVFQDVQRSEAMAERSGMTPPGESDIGSRMTIRLHDEEPGKFRDLLGHLVDLTHVRDKHGTIKAFDPDQILAWKKLDR